ALLQAYAGRRKLSDADREALPLLARGATMRFLLTRLVDWLNVPPGALVKPKDPLEYYRKLRFHQAVASVRDYAIQWGGGWQSVASPFSPTEPARAIRGRAAGVRSCSGAIRPGS